MTTTTHYDLIIIGTGAGGGTLAYHLAPTGKKILILERGSFLLQRESQLGHDASCSKRSIPYYRSLVRRSRS
jgi:choline dehydrogenase-like flavoprotein